MLKEEQIDLRRQRARAANFHILNHGKKRVFSEFTVTNPQSGGVYEVQIRSFDTGDNTCTCRDFKSNTLGTCKHIEAVLETLRDDLPAQTQKKRAVITRPEIELDYGEQVRLRLRLPTRHSDALEKLARRFFDDRGLWADKAPLEDLIPAVEAVPEEVLVRSDALEWLDRDLERQQLARKEALWLLQLEEGTLCIPGLKVPLYDYQAAGAIFLACRGRAILADDMGLGKTIQTLAAVELLQQERGLSRVLIVAPASVKYQWAHEIERFTDRTVQVLEGDAEDRTTQYQTPSLYKIVHYEQVIKDRAAMNAWKPDLVVLDEAQRIKNWETKTSQEVKKLQSRYAFVLTGTPLENKLEELYSIVSFVDERRFGPAFAFLHEHRVLDDQGKLVGYRHLDRIRDKLAPILLRRTRAEVLPQLPPRTDNIVSVPLSPLQQERYDEQRSILGRLVGKGTLTDLDRRRILACLVQLRMLCNGVQDDEGTWHSPKLEELAELLPELLGADPRRKIVLFSQWETFLRAAAAVAERLGLPLAFLHGGLPAQDRQQVLDRFRQDPECRLFFSTDAGGVGLNLQQADTVVNLEWPWNPAVLAQRLARVHRLGQERAVRAIHFVTQDSLEARVWQVNQAKQQLFEGLFQGEEDELSWPVGTAGKVLQQLGQLLPELTPQHPAQASAGPTPGILRTPAVPQFRPTTTDPPASPPAKPRVSLGTNSPAVQLVASLLTWIDAAGLSPEERLEIQQLWESWANPSERLGSTPRQT